MLIKLPDGYLDFNDSIEIERQIKLFEDLETTDGDYSYRFEAPMTSNNIHLLENPFPDNRSKRVYEKIDCELLDDEGNQLYFGSLRIERVTTVFELSFFAGNNNWFGLLAGPISDIDFSDFDQAQDVSNILVRMAATSGVVFSLVDNGGLVTRGYRQVKVEDYVAGMYVHTVFKRIFTFHSIKIQGDLFNEPLYWKLITQRNGKSQSQIDAASSYVEAGPVSRPVENDEYPADFTNDSTYPFYDGSLDPFDITTNSWTAPFKTKIHIELSFVPSIVDATYNQRIYIYINGVFTFVDIGLIAGGLYNSATPGDQTEFVLDRTFVVEQGDVLTWTTQWQQSGGSTQNDVVSGWVKITPVYIYKVFGDSIVPAWTQGEYVANVFKIFNVLPHFNSFTKTLTLNVFDKIRDKEAIDLSPFISNTEIDYIDFISNYGKRNILSYQEVDFDDLRDYNIQNFFKYGSGVITSDNGFLEDSADLIESDFSNPQSYINPVFDMSMERLNLIQLEQTDNTQLTAVNDSAGVARFVIDEDIFLVDDLVRVESTNPFYSKDWVVDTVTPETGPGVGDGYVTFVGLSYDTSATGTLTKLEHKYNESDDVYLLVQIPFYLVSSFSGFSTIKLESFDRTEMSTAYFNLLQQGRVINDDYKQSLSFGEIDHPLFYQRTIVETYWQLVQRIFNDPVKLFNQVYIPHKLFIAIDFLSPVKVSTEETFNLYYMNKITGYEGNDCEVQLNKITVMAEETILLNVKIDQSDAQKQLEKTEKSIISLKKEQAALTKEYKAGKVSEDEYIKSNLALQKAITKETDQKRTLIRAVDTESNSRNSLKLKIAELVKEYDNLNTETAEGQARQKALAAELTKLNDQFNKSSNSAGLFKDQIGNYPKAFADAAGQIKVAGVSVGDFGAKALAFANPVTAAVGVVGLLGSAFLATRDGAELLESAQFKLQAGFQILGRETSSLVDKLKGLVSEDTGTGKVAKTLLLTNPAIQAVLIQMKVLDKITGGYISRLAQETQALADAKAAYDDLLRAQLEESEQVAELDRQISNLTTKREEETTTVQERVAMDREILGLEKERFDILVANAIRRRDQLEVEAEKQGGVNKLTDTQLQLLVNTRNEVKNLEGEYAQRTKKILSDIDSINDKLGEQAKKLREAADEVRKAESADARAQRRALDFAPDAKTVEQDVETPAMKREARETEFLIEEGQIRFDATQDLNKALLKSNKEFYDKDLAFKKHAAELKERVDEAQLAAAASILGSTASLFDQASSEYKILATAQTLISTYAAAQKSYESLSVIPVIGPELGFAAAAAAVVAGLANVAAINGVEFAEGGFTGPGSKYQPAGIVHAGEYVAPQSVVNSPMAQPHIAALEGMRKGYADGGFVAEQNISPYQNALMTANAIRNLPQPVIGVREFNRVANRVQVRESVSKL